MGLWDKIKDGLTVDKGEVAEDAKAKADQAKAEADKAQQEAEKADAAAKEQAQQDGTAAPAPEPPAAAPERDDEVHAKEPHKHKHHLREYTVVSGDTLSEIGARFGVDWHDIARINDIPNPDLIYPGQVFKIPAS